MADLTSALEGVHSGVHSLLAAVDAAAPFWTVPRAPGKWSPSQVAEHVARIMEESANVAAGVPSKFPTVPSILRPITRVLVFKRILRRKSFLKMKTGGGFDPPNGPATAAQAHERLEDALNKFDEACRSRAQAGQKVSSTIFGPVSVADFVRFQELHVRHHIPQISAQR
jgi:hypothetical protein